MKQGKNILMGLMMLFLFACQTDYNLIDTGLSNGKHDVPMWDYFHTDRYNWDSTIVMIKRAGLEDIFKGTNKEYETITFFGPTNHSIRRYLYRNDMNQVADMDVETCKEIILSSVVKGKYMRDDIPLGKREEGSLKGKGGTELTMASGKKLWVYTFRESYEDVPETGPVTINIISLSTSKQTRVASSNIETTSGVVHSLMYSFTIKDF